MLFIAVATAVATATATATATAADGSVIRPFRMTAQGVQHTG